jgi:hypothetical protein
VDQKEEEETMRKLWISTLLVAVCVFTMVGSTTKAGGGSTSVLFAPLSGYNEAPTTYASPAFGQFTGTVSADGSSIDYELTYDGFTTNVAAAHIHLGAAALSGGVTIFLCGGGGRPACTSPSGDITGTITADNVLGLPTQDLAAGDLPKILEAMAAGATYVNVHTTLHGGGEIRGQIQVAQSGANQ